MDPKPQVEFDQGFFKFTKPYTWQGWVWWLVIIGVMIGALFFQPQGYIISLCMFVVLAMLSPTGLESKLHAMRKKNPQPEDLEAQALISGATVEDWFYGKKTYVPTNDPNDWVYPAPGPKSWYLPRPYHPDPSNELLPEHPTKIGTPRPAVISSYGLFLLIFLGGMSSLAYFGVTSAQSTVDSSDDTLLLLPYITMGVGVLWLILGYFAQRHQSVMMDTSTALARSVAAGSGELVGQVRPTFSGGIDVLVDHHPMRMVPGCVAYKWEYEVEIRESKIVMRNGKPRRRTQNRWVNVRSKEGSVPFILHDGTGGIYLRPSTFERQDFGGFVKQWTTTHSQSLSDAYWRIQHGRLYNQGHILRHRWTIHALRIGDPVYALGMVKPRPSEELEWPGVCDVVDFEAPSLAGKDDGTFWSQEEKSKVNYNLPVSNARLHMIGTDTPGMPAMLKRGTELANIARLRSRSELMFIPFLTAVAGSFMLLWL
ncbi:MAG: hypothetical protein P8Q98_06380 [Candidatus Poseidoniaceae archaeon]|nr:hypothetical protein [Candidatus Poseidoniaceae archaeon]